MVVQYLVEERDLDRLKNDQTIIKKGNFETINILCNIARGLYEQMTKLFHISAIFEQQN